jgi:hypothetical protein
MNEEERESLKLAAAALCKAIYYGTSRDAIDLHISIAKQQLVGEIDHYQMAFGKEFIKQMRKLKNAH